jgi:PKD repeat protein
MRVSICLIRHFFALLVTALPMAASGQCPVVYDFYGTPSDSPYWYSCSGNSFSFNLQSPNNWGAYTIDWGDGTPGNSGVSWNSPSVINHVYAAAVDTFVVTITELATGCVIEGVVVMEQATSASIQIPVGGLTQACAPQVMEFINSSTNVSETTTFIWDFGDGTTPLTFDHTNWNQMVSHLYDVGTVNCETVVSLIAENYCNTIQGGESTATFNPIRIWDLDDPGITASSTLLCYPDTTVTFTNTTHRNCLFQGNIYQRYEYWNFGDYWGLGYDSIIDWTPWPPTFPRTMHYPGTGTYTVELLDSNFCGIAPATITIQIVPPPVAGISASATAVCPGQPITFYQQATGSPNAYYWNFGFGWIPTGSGNITYSFPNPGTYVVQSRVAVEGASSACDDIAELTITVLPPPALELLATPTVACDEADVTFTSVTTNAVAWNWTFGTAPGTFSGELPPVVHYEGAGVYTATLSITASNGCTASDFVNITIYPTPEAAFTVTNLCEGDTAQFWDITPSFPNSPIISWNWDFGDGATSAAQHPDHYYSSVGQFDVTLTASSGFCTDSTTGTVNVEPRPNAVALVDEVSGCSPLTVTFSHNSSGAVTYLWTLGDGTISDQETVTHTYTNNTGTDSTYQIVLSAFNAFGCESRDTIYLEVLANAVAAFSDNNAIPSCSPFDAVFINQSLYASSYLWDFGDGGTSIAVNPSHQYVNNTGFLQIYMAELIAFASNGCHDTTSNPIIVFPLNNFAFNMQPASGCSPLSVQMPLIQGVQTYQWNFGDGATSALPTPVHQYVNNTAAPVDYTITLTGTSPFGCTSTTTSTITVYPNPVAQFTSDITAGCSPLVVNLNNMTLNASSYSWNYGDGQSSANDDAWHAHTFVNTTGQTQNYTLTLTASSPFGCNSVATLNVQVYPQVTASFNAPSFLCSPAEAFFANTGTPGQIYEWNFGNGQSSAQHNGQTTYQTSGPVPETFNVLLQVTSTQGCTATANQPVTVNPAPVAEFALDQNQACSPAPVVLVNQSTGANSFTWNYGDGTFSNNAQPEHSHVYNEVGNTPEIFQIVLQVTSSAGCSDSYSQQFTLFPGVVAAFAGAGSGCSPFNAVFVNQSQGADEYTWSFGDGSYSTEVNPNHLYIAGGMDDLTFEAELQVSNSFGCSESTSAIVTVNHNPVANVNVIEAEGCLPTTVQLQNNTIGADSYFWNYGNGETSQTSAENHEFIYFNYAPDLVNHTITLTAMTDQGCISTDQVQVQVPDQVIASFQSISTGCTPLQVLFDNSSTSGFSYYWAFGDGDISNQEEPAHTYFNWGATDTTYQVMLVVQNAFGCADTAYGEVTVHPIPVASFDVSPFIQTWPDATIAIDNTSTGGSLIHDWEFGDGAQSELQDPGTHTYATWGTYSVELNVTNGSCSDSEVQEVIILPAPPSIAFLGPAEGCAPLTVNFTNQSSNFTSSFWQFGDGGTANATNPVYTYYQPGTYTVTLTITGHDGAPLTLTQEYIIEVYPRAIALFSLAPSEVSIPSQPLYCMNLSQNATIYEWNFGDGSTSAAANPVYYYQGEGIFTVSLAANNEFNCPDTMTVVDAVYASVSGMIDFPNAFTPNTSGASGGAYDPFGFDNDVFFPMHRGVAEYQLQIFNKWGELLFESNDVYKGWDGYYRGILCRQDVYAWKVKARFADGQKYENAGDVTLLVK